MPQSVIIIGGGIAGLSAGCYAQMNGYSSQIFELHTIPGGLCTSWRRGGYTMDGCLQYLTGSGAQADAHRIWDELGALDGKQVYDRDEFIRIESGDGRALAFFTNADELQAHLLALDPDDRELIDDLCDGIRDFADFDLPIDKPETPLENLKFGMSMMPFLPAVLKWNRLSMWDFAARFRDPFVREALPHFFQFAHPTFPMTVMLITLAMMHRKNAGYPLGGSLKFALGIARRYEGLGGRIHYRSRVRKIIVENDTAVGVLLEGGSEVRADIVISAADGYDTIFTMLDGRYLDNRIRRYYKELPVAGPILQVSLGVARNLSGLPHSINFPMSRPTRIAGKMHDRLVARHYAYDPGMAPAGKTALTLWLDADYEYWKRIYDLKQLYDDAQDEVAEIVVDELEQRFPGLKPCIEVVDVATPPTYERFTENWRGAIAGWSITKGKMTMMMGKGMKKQLPGLRNFYMIGQWVEPAGNVELSAASGRDVVKLLCAADGQPFVTSLPENAAPHVAVDAVEFPAVVA